ncbi:MAG: hypothetical protein K6T85_08365 [Gorillibacterium sp.]|nr:hypothetical protein [Gorillibacterium sp.]
MIPSRLHKIHVDADHPYFSYSGRMDDSNKKAVLIHYPGSYIRTRFTGTSLGLLFSLPYVSYPHWINCQIDGVEYVIQLQPGAEEREYPVAVELDHGEHDLTIIRMNDFCSGVCAFHGISIDADSLVMKPAPKPKRRLECYGDSLTAGCLSDVYERAGMADDKDMSQEEITRRSNGGHSFANVLARRLDAEIHNNGMGGLSLMDGYGYVTMPDTIGLETTWDKLNPIPQFGEITAWDFRRYTPHIVVIAIGQNDSSTYPDILTDAAAKVVWTSRYTDLLHRLRRVYPHAYLLLTGSVKIHPLCWEEVLFEIAEKFADPKVLAYRYKRAGLVTPGHIRLAEAEEMAEELEQFIGTLDNPWSE